MVNVRSAAVSGGTGIFYAIAIFLLTMGFDWMQNLETHPWYGGLAMIAVGVLVFVVDRYYNLEG